MTDDIQASKHSILIRFWKEHLPFYITAFLLTAATSAFYLFARHSGSNSAWLGLPLDDGWIHLVYARSLAEQGWFYYNPGIPEAGMSSPLWVLLLALGHKLFSPLGVPPQWFAKGLSLFFSLGVPLATYHLARQIRLTTKWAWFAGLLSIIEPNLAYGNVAGMEVSLFIFLTFVALWLAHRHHYLPTGILLALGLLTRAEGILNIFLVGIAALMPVYLKRRELSLLTKEEFKIGLKIFLPALFLGVAWAFYNHSVNGHWLPNSYFVKHNFALGGFNLENLGNVLAGYVGHLAMFHGWVLPVTLLLLGAGVWSLIHSKQFLAAAPIALIPLLQLYAFSINIKVVAGETPWTYFTRRYMDFLLPFTILLVTLGAAFLWEQVSRLQRRWIMLSAPLVALALAALFGWNIIQSHVYMVEQYSWNTDNVEQVNVVMGRWIGENIPAGATIGVTDAGAMRYWSRSDQVIIDFLGLNCAACMGRPLEELITEFQPGYLVVFRPALNGSFGYEELHSIQARRNTILGGNELVAVKRKP